MTGDLKVDLFALLPAGEWASVQILNQAAGMMASRNWAILAKAKWLRGGGKPAFIKFIIPAGPQAGRSTLMVTSDTRLQDLHNRLLRLQQVGDAVPIVPLLEIRHTDDGLLIAMEEVTPLEELIERGEAYDLSQRILQDLDPETDAAHRWLHFDICPRNIGVLPSGRCVLIDVESLYLEEGNRYRVTVPAWKPFRAPRQLVDDVNDKLEKGAIDRVIAARKVRFEIALAAAECVLGPLTPERGNLDRALLESWFSVADPSDPAVAFWRQELFPAVDRGDVRPIAELCKGLEAAFQGRSELLRAPLLQPVAQVVVPAAAADAPQPAPTSAPRSESALPPGWSNDWKLLGLSAHALRAGRLDRVHIAEYRAALEQLASQYPSQREVWDELLLVVISYEKNAAAALAIANAALVPLPNDHDLIRLRNIIQMWVMERQNGGHGGR